MKRKIEWQQYIKKFKIFSKAFPFHLAIKTSWMEMLTRVVEFLTGKSSMSKSMPFPSKHCINNINILMRIISVYPAVISLSVGYKLFRL